jgi:stringent starvation protein B
MMTATKPYLIRAFYEWIVDNNCTPHIVVNAEILGTDVPREYIEGGQIVLNISTTAVQALVLSNDTISFKARFNGIPRDINIVMDAVMAIYARENGRGMVFTEDDNEPPPTKTLEPKKISTTNKKSGKRSGGKSSHLTVVK